MKNYIFTIGAYSVKTTLTVIYKILQLKLNAYKPDKMSDSCTKNSQIYGKVKVTSAVCHAAAAAISTWQRGKQNKDAQENTVLCGAVVYAC